MAGNRAVIFDRDGIVNIRIIQGYITNPEQFCFLGDFVDFFNNIKNLGYLAILATNQQGIGKSIMTIDDLQSIHNYMQYELERITSYKFDDIYFCPELREANSFRRKPNPGMLLEAIAKWNISPSESWMVGDNISDVEAGKAAGLKTILITNKKLSCKEADYIFNDLHEAFEKIKGLL